MPGRDYNFISRLTHKIALYNRVAELSFDIENAVVKRKADLPDNHVFISGLARSGTTALLNYLYETGEVKSLTYADMPFVLMPNTWKKISHKKASGEHRERAHKDGIRIGAHSPEAFEEVFWRVFFGKNYIRDDRLLLNAINADLSNKFKTYIGNILSGDDESKKRYLSKNNNNILRIEYLQKDFPEAYIIVPFRDPLQQAISLLNQHIHFSEIHKTDGFSLSYMNWLGHFEFGLNQKPFFFGDQIVFKELFSYPKTNINFWLLSWKNYYQYAGNYVGDNMIFFNYEKFCAEPEASLAQLFLKIGVSKPDFELKPFKAITKTAEGFDEKLLNECNSIYKEMVSKSG